MSSGGTCLRCGTPYEPDDTVCYHCGAPIGESEGDTAPVRVVRVNGSTNAAPAAADAEGQAAAAVAPPAPGGQGENAGVDSAEPQEVDISRITVGSARTAHPASGAAPFAAPIRRARGRRFPWVAAILVIVAVIVAALAGALFARQGTTTTPPVARQTLYTDPAGRFSFQRPALWSVTRTTSGVSLTDSSGSSSVVVALATPGVAGVPADMSATTYADQLARQLGGATPLAALPARTIGGAQWERREGQVTGADGAVRETLVLVTEHDGTLYAITCTSPVANFAATTNLVFDPLLGSFAFGA
jgi:hypothetical protein